MKILVVKDRNAVGAQFVNNLLNILADCGHEVALVCSSYSKAGTGTLQRDGIRVLNLLGKTRNPLVNFWLRILDQFGWVYFRYRRLLRTERPDLIIPFFPKDLAHVCFCQPKTAPIIQMIHDYPPMLFKGIAHGVFHRRWINFRCFEKVDFFQVLMNGFCDSVSERYPGVPVCAIGNVVPEIGVLPEFKSREKRIVYVARVKETHKRQHLAAEAFGRIAHKYPGWTLEFWGVAKYSEYNRKLLKIAEKYNVADRVHLKGTTKDVLGLFKSAAFQVFTSEYEGFGMALAEGLACGCPAIGFRYAPAVNEIVVDQKNGLLADDLDGLVQGMEKMMSDDDFRFRCSLAAPESVRRWRYETIRIGWNALLNKVRVRGVSG